MKARTFLMGILVLFASLFFGKLDLAQGVDSQEWPVEIDTDQGVIIVYEPQWETLVGNKLTGRAAVSLTPSGSSAPVFGAVWFSTMLSTDMDKRTYELASLDVTDARFPNSAAEVEDQLTSILETELPKRDLHGSLDALLATLETAQKQEQESEDLATAPPKVIYVDHPAVLLLLDGEPELSAIQGASLMRVVNTPMLLVQDKSNKRYYLSSGNAWYSANDYKGPWAIDHNPPAAVSALVTDNGQPVANIVPDSMMPKIIVSTVPAELIVSQGAPQYAAVAGTSLLYMSNTENDVFMDIPTQSYFVLLSGRWYVSRSLQGPWNYARPDQLPADFAKIAPDSAKGDALASVPGTTQAEEALTENQIPQTAAVQRSEAKLEVEYDGEPQWVRVSGLGISYADNADTPVFLVAGSYYACADAVWFVAASPFGPWTVADYVPPVIYELPASCPFYNVRYVYIYDYTPELVYFGYTPGYYGWYPFDGIIVFGTGYYYHGWYHHHYFPRPCTYGFHAHYARVNWGFGYSWSCGFMTVGYAWHRDWHEHGWYGPAGFRGYRPADVFMQRNVVVQRNFNLYQKARFGNEIHVSDRNYRVQGPAPINFYNRPENVGRVVSRPGIPQGAIQPQVLRGQPNNVFTDKEGNVYRRNPQGWERNNGPGWGKVQPSVPVPGPGERKPSGPWRDVKTVPMPPQTNKPQNQHLQEHQPTQPQRNKQGGRAQEYNPAPQAHEQNKSTGPAREYRQSPPVYRSAPTVPDHVQRDYQARQRGEQRPSNQNPGRNNSRGGGASPSKGGGGQKGGGGGGQGGGGGGQGGGASQGQGSKHDKDRNQ